MADSEQNPKRGGSRNEGKSWVWGALKRNAKIYSREHLVFRYLADTKMFSAEELAGICETTVNRIKSLIYYGKSGTKTMRTRMVMQIAERMGMNWAELMQTAEAWHSGDEPGELSAKVESLHHKRVYGFRKMWLHKMGWNEKTLKIMKQTTDFLLPDGIAPGDLLLINTEDKIFAAGAFYAVTLADETRACMGAMRGTQRLLVVESTGRKFLHADFEEVEQGGGIIGRIVWKGSLMPGVNPAAKQTGFAI
jgi:hypothetical protein